MFTGPIPANRALARRICIECPAANVCAWYGIALEADIGLRQHVYGGLTPAEREAFVRKYSVTAGQAWDEYEKARGELWSFMVESAQVRHKDRADVQVLEMPNGGSQLG